MFRGLTRKTRNSTALQTLVLVRLYRRTSTSAARCARRRTCHSTVWGRRRRCLNVRGLRTLRRECAKWCLYTGKTNIECLWKNIEYLWKKVWLFYSQVGWTNYRALDTCCDGCDSWVKVCSLSQPQCAVRPMLNLENKPYTFFHKHSIFFHKYSIYFFWTIWGVSMLHLYSSVTSSGADAAGRHNQLLPDCCSPAPSRERYSKCVLVCFHYTSWTRPPLVPIV